MQDRDPVGPPVAIVPLPRREAAPCAAWLMSAGLPLTKVRELLGHSTIRMTERYAHLAPENVRAAVARLEVQTKGRCAPKRRRRVTICHVGLEVILGGRA
ncbi:MAG: tyrosine-type recombinase/integrase [Chromatiaceae bacterium]